MNAITRTQLAELYGFSTRTLSNRLKKLGVELPARQLVTPAKQIEIYATLGIPGKLPEAEAEKLKPKVLAYCRSNGITDTWRF
jgi:transcriptional antiterminator